MLILQY